MTINDGSAPTWPVARSHTNDRQKGETRTGREQTVEQSRTHQHASSAGGHSSTIHKLRICTSLTEKRRNYS